MPEGQVLDVSRQQASTATGLFGWGWEVGRGRGPGYPGPTGSSEAVTRLRLPQNVVCGSPALRSSGIVSQHCKSLQRPIGQPQLWLQQRDPLFEPVEVSPGEVTACPTAAAKHLAP